jgi:predicted metal-binding membrane protein
MNPAAAPLERGLVRERLWVGAGLGLAVAACWAWLVPLALDMQGAMTGSAAWMMRADWDAVYFVAIFGMWVAMMIGMMLPSAAPTLLLYATVVRKSPEAGDAVPRVYAFAAGYVLVWSGFSLLATILQWGLARRALLSPMMQADSPQLGASLLCLAGLYQLTPWKRACLAQCRAPAVWISAHWRRGLAGALRMGLHHGAYCLGCCWALMLLLFAGGVMNLVWIGAITLFVLLEKLAPHGAQGGRLSGALLIVCGAARLLAG